MKSFRRETNNLLKRTRDAGLDYKIAFISNPPQGQFINQAKRLLQERRKLEKRQQTRNARNRRKSVQEI